MLEPNALQRIAGIGGPPLVCRMIDLVLTNGPQRLERARQALDATELRAVEEAVHSLKSSAGNVGAETLRELCQQIEDLAAAGSAAGIPALMPALHAEWDQVRRALEAERKGLES